MKNNDKKHIGLALFMMGLLTAGTEILTEYISGGTIKIISIQFFFGVIIALIYCALALRVSKPKKNNKP